MKIGILQFSPVFGEKDKNLATIRTLLEGIDADLVVLPELALTGYFFKTKEEVKDLAENIKFGPSIEKLKAIAKKEDVHIVTGFLEESGGKFYNSAVLIYPQGNLEIYRKVHLFSEEKLFFEPGDLGFPVYNIGTFKIGMMVCFDWIFPEAARSLALNGADIIAHPANLVLPFCQDAMITRSIENRIFTVTANRSGKDVRGEEILTFTGKSQVVSPEGKRILIFSEDEEGVKVVDVDPHKARDKNITKYNNIFEDRRPDLYNIDD